MAQIAAKLLTAHETFFSIIEWERLDIRSSVGIKGTLFSISGHLFDTVVRDKRYYIADIEKPYPYTGAELMF